MRAGTCVRGHAHDLSGPGSGWGVADSGEREMKWLWGRKDDDGEGDPKGGRLLSGMGARNRVR